MLCRAGARVQQVPSGEKVEGRVFSWLEYAFYMGFALLQAQQQRGCSDVGGEASRRQNVSEKWSFVKGGLSGRTPYVRLNQPPV